MKLSWLYRRQSSKLAPEFSGKVLQYNIPHEEAAAKYGLWEVRALRAFMCRGDNIEVGDTVKVPGNSAVDLVAMDSAEFVDSKIARESELIQEAKALGLDKPVQLPPGAFEHKRNNRF